MRKKQLIAKFELTTSALVDVGAKLAAAERQVHDLQHQLTLQGDKYEMRLRDVSYHTGEFLKGALPDKLFSTLASKLSASEAHYAQIHLDRAAEGTGSALMAITQSQVARCTAILKKAEQVAKEKEAAELKASEEQKQKNAQREKEERDRQLRELGELDSTIPFADYYKAVQKYATLMKVNTVLNIVPDHKLVHECYSLGMYASSTYNVVANAKAE